MEIKNQILAYKILDLIDKNGGSMVYTDIINAFLPDVSPSETDNTLTRMLAEGLISGKIPSTSSITMTPKGEDELYAFRRNLSEEAAKVELPIKSNDAANNSPTSTKNTKPSKKRKLSKKGNTATIAGIITLTTAIITLIAVVIDKFF